MAKLYGVGVGPGDPELLTLKAVRVINECMVIVVPTKSIEDSLAYKTALDVVPSISTKELIGIDMPMSKDKDLLIRAHTNAAEIIIKKLDEEKDVAFLTLGDPGIYSTYTYIQELVAKKGYETVTVNGIASFLYAGALVNDSIVIKDEILSIIPSTFGIEDAFKMPGTKVFMKAGKKLKDIKAQVSFEDKVYFLENCGVKGERIIKNIDGIPDESGYYSIVIVKDKDAN